MAESTTTPPRSALIVVDVQEDFCEPNGSLAVKGGRELFGVWNELLKLPFAVKIASQDWHPQNHISFASQHDGAAPFTSQHTIVNPSNPAEPFTTLLWPDHCIQNTTGADLIPELDSSALDHIVKKGQEASLESYSAFGPAYRRPKVALTELVDLLTKMAIEQVFVVGLAYDFCVKSTAVDAAEFGFKTFIIEAGTRGVNHGAQGIAELRSELKGKNVNVVQEDGSNAWKAELAGLTGFTV